MMELDESFSLNDRYLIDEYLKHGTDDFLLFDVDDKTFVVPYQYTVGSKTPKEAIEKCKKALFDFQNEEIEKYQKARKEPEILHLEDTDIVVPFTRFHHPYACSKLIQQFVEKAEAKYNMVINTHRSLNLMNTGEITPVDLSAAALEKNVHLLGMLGEGVLLANHSDELLAICNFVEKCGKNTFEKFKTTKEKLSNGLKKMVINNEHNALKRYCPKHWKIALLSTAITMGGIWGTSYLNNTHSDDKKEVVQNFSYTDCFGNEHSDQFGNLKLMNQIKPEITALILSIEGFAEDAFLEGGKRPTVGSGFTYHINESGVMTPVKMGHKMNYQDNEEQINRYIDLTFSNLLGDGVGKKLSKNEILACVGAGFCWGKDAFGKSSFFNSVKEGEDISEQQRKLTGFRNPIGLVKREYLLAKVLSGEWTTKDLLDMPIYLIKDKGYLHCGIYTLDLAHCVPCQKDKNGKYITDKSKNKRPIICADGFCKDFTDDSDKSMLNSIINAPTGKASYKTVRDLLSDDMCVQIENANLKDTYGAATAFNLTAHKKSKSL